MFTSGVGTSFVQSKAANDDFSPVKFQRSWCRLAIANSEQLLYAQPCRWINLYTDIINCSMSKFLLTIIIIGASLSEPHCYVANRDKRNALWCVRTRNFSTLIKIPSACDRNFYQFVVNLRIVFPSSQLLRQFTWLRISQDASHFARRNLLAELVEQ